VLISPRAGVGGVDRVQADAVPAGLRGHPVAEHRGRDAGHRPAEAFAARSSPHRFPADGAGVGEIEVFNGDGRDAVPRGVADDPGDRMPDLGIPTR
jgi:hypothetical protein